jgi:hypothetical protein
MASARLHEIPSLRRAICNYVDQDSYMAIRITPEKSPVFSMHVAMTFPVFRECKLCINCTSDMEKGWKGLVPRKATPLPTLSSATRTGARPVACIVLTHSSVLVVGRSRSRWTAYSFAGTRPRLCPRCSDEDHRGEDDDENDCNSGRRMDPVTLGKCEAMTLAKLGPRNYFLRVVQHRVRVVSAEWANTLGWLQKRLDSYVSLTSYFKLAPEIHQDLKHALTVARPD